MKVGHMNQREGAVEVSPAGNQVTQGQFLPRGTANRDGQRVYDSPPYVSPYCVVERKDGTPCRNLPLNGQDRCIGHMGKGNPT